MNYHQGGKDGGNVLCTSLQSSLLIARYCGNEMYSTTTLSAYRAFRRSHNRFSVGSPVTEAVTDRQYSEKCVLFFISFFRAWLQAFSRGHMKKWVINSAL